MNCPSCGAEAMPEHLFCGSCGAKLPSAAPVQTQDASPVTPAQEKVVAMMSGEGGDGLRGSFDVFVTSGRIVFVREGSASSFMGGSKVTELLGKHGTLDTSPLVPSAVAASDPSAISVPFDAVTRAGFAQKLFTRYLFVRTANMKMKLEFKKKAELQMALARKSLATRLGDRFEDLVAESREAATTWASSGP